MIRLLRFMAGMVMLASLSGVTMMVAPGVAYDGEWPGSCRTVEKSLIHFLHLVQLLAAPLDHQVSLRLPLRCHIFRRDRRQWVRSPVVFSKNLLQSLGLVKVFRQSSKSC